MKKLKCYFQTLTWLLGCGLFFCIALPFTSLAQEATAITNNNYDDGNLAISGNNLVWIGGNEIFHYNLNQETPPVALTNDSIIKLGLQISGDRVVWNGTTNPADISTFEIYYYKINESEAVTQITNNSIPDGSPSISDNRLVWDSQISTMRKIFYKDLSMPNQDSVIVANNGKSHGLPTISGHHVAGYYLDGTDSDVFYYDLSTDGPPKYLSNTAVFVFDIQISDDKLWWRGWHGDIRYFDLNTQDTPVLFHTANPPGFTRYLHVGDGYVVWTTYDGAQRNIYYLNLMDQNEPIQIYTDDLFDRYPIVSGGYIIWQGGEQDGGNENNTEIYYYDLLNGGPVVQLTQNDFQDRSLKAKGNRIFWEGGYAGQEDTYEIYTATLPEIISSNEDLQEASFQISGIYPNPASETVTVEYVLEEQMPVSVILSDINGKALKLHNPILEGAGKHQYTFNIENLPLGLYFCTFQVNNAIRTKSFVKGGEK